MIPNVGNYCGYISRYIGNIVTIRNLKTVDGETIRILYTDIEG